MYQKSPSIAELIKWLKGYIDNTISGYFHDVIYFYRGPVPMSMNIPQNVPPTAPYNPLPTAPVSVQGAAPELSVPVKPVSNISLIDPDISHEINEVCKSMTNEELKVIANDKSKLEEFFSNRIKGLDDSKKKLSDYIDLLRKQSINVIELRNQLKSYQTLYDEKVQEYESIKITLREILEKINAKKTGGTNIQTFLYNRMKRADQACQNLRSEFKKSHVAATTNEAIMKEKNDVEEFLKKYLDAKKEYQKCDIIRNTLGKQ